MVSKIFFHTLDENGLVIEPGSHPNYNRITSDGPVRVTYKVEDNETKQNYATFQDYSEWYKNDDLSTRQKKEYPNNWLYYETSDIKLELNQEAKEFKAGDKVKLKVTIENKSKNLPNSRLMSGIDFGVKKNNLVDKDDVKADLELSYGADGTVIPGVLKAGDSKVMETEITLSNEIKEEYLNEDGNIVLTPFLLTSNLDNASGKTIAYKHLNEREYNDTLVLDYDENNQGGGDGGSGGGGGSETKNYVILASGDKYTDVLTATVLGNEKKCPILLTDKNKVSDNTLKEIDRLNADKIIISGGPQSVS